MKSGLRRRGAAVGVALSLAALAALAVAGGAASAAPGDLDPGFGGASHGRVQFDMGDGDTLQDLAVQPDGGIVTVGLGAGAVTGTVDALAYRLHADGTPDSAFARVRLPGPTEANELALAAVAQSDGKIVVAGFVTDVNGHSDIGVWRLTRTGELDTSFGDHGLFTSGSADNDERAFDVALDPQGRIVVAGFMTGLDPDVAVLRLTTRGALDPTFNRGQPFDLVHPGTDGARSVAVQSDGLILVTGDYAGASGNPVLRIKPGTANADAALDKLGFGGGDGVAEVPGTLRSDTPDVAVKADGKVLFLGAVSVAGGSLDGTVVRLTSLGVVDDSFGSATGAHIDVEDNLETLDALTLLPHGAVAVLGHVPGGPPFVAKLRATGAPDPGMGSQGVRTLPGLTAGSMAGVAALRDGRIITAGNASSTAGVAYRLLGDLTAPSCHGKKATIVGTASADHLVGTGRVDVIAGLGGADRITGLGKGDIVCGGRGGDTISGGTGADKLFGQAGRDTMSGGKGDDKLVGGTGHDTLHGGPGHDTLKP